MSAVSSSFSGVGSNFTNSSFFSMSDLMVIPDDWKDLAQQFISDGNGGPAIDAFCNAWAGESSSGAVLPDSAYYHGATLTTAIWNHAMTKTFGWMMVMLLKTIFLEEKFNRWSGAYRFLNLGSTLFPFGMATWAIYSGMGETGGDTVQEKEQISNLDTLMILGNHLFNTPAVRQWLVTGLAWALFHRLVLARVKATKIFTALEWIPGIGSLMISLACWLLGETTVATRLLGDDYQPNTLLVYATAMRWAAHTVTAWYCYAVTVQAVLGTQRFTSFSWFLVTVVAGKIALSGYIF